MSIEGFALGALVLKLVTMLVARRKTIFIQKVITKKSYTNKKVNGIFYYLHALCIIHGTKIDFAITTSLASPVQSLHKVFFGELQ